MALYAAPSPSHADPVIQPSFYTSSIYVDAFKADIEALVTEFHSRYIVETSKPPFSLFKEIWHSQGWKWLHFKVLDDRSRESYLHVSFRLFLEKFNETRIPLHKAAALFGLYTFYATQPENTTPRLWNLTHIPIPSDWHNNLFALPEQLQEPTMRPLLICVLSVLEYLANKSVFLILPNSDSLSQNPRALPREIYVDQGSVGATFTKKRGRPNKNEKTKRLKAGLAEAEDWLSRTEGLAPTQPTSPFEDYTRLKSEFTSAAELCSATSQGHIAAEQANESILLRLREVSSLLSQEQDGPIPDSEMAGLRRVENAVEDMRQGLGSGVLGLLEGSGRRASP
ncbi:hypothetical protein BKA70DRAFT_1417668 [Coprinopsis sp. MPI-PUGE-AT-0042]|nr:hypothetical protein BKA70DRAFT_1417668 [Coprinopsis sp. MPI-PUGE-AT-0042]